MIFDTHAHYNDSAFAEDRESLLKSLNDNNIGLVAEISASIEDTGKIVELCEKYNFIYGAIGVHPEYVDKMTDSDIETLKNASKHSKIVSVGEIGLDYHYEDGASREVQIKWFKAQLELAKELNLPVVIHSRDAAEDTLNILKEYGKDYIKGVIHCFSYSPEMAEEFVKLGYYIGVGGVVTFKNGKKLKETVTRIPLERILIETDCPYMAPTPHRGERNSSLFLPLVIKEVAELTGKSIEEIENVTYNNGKSFYGL